jgi:hypothetical protein
MAGKPLTNSEAANLIRALTKIQQQKAMTRMVSERPLGGTPARKVPTKTGLSKSETKQVQTKQDVTVRRVAPTGPRASVGEKTPVGGRPRVGTAFNNPIVNPTADQRTRDADAIAKANAARAARDATAAREQREAETSAKTQANDAARGRAQSPKAEPKTREVVDEQARVGLSGKPTANKASVQAVVKARNRIEANARLIKSQKAEGQLGDAHMGGHGIGEGGGGSTGASSGGVSIKYTK